MAQSVIHLTQSRFYSPMFNAAVFDGPIRIYFAQHQEDIALNVYHHLQQFLKDSYATFRKNFRQHGHTVFVMLYPNVEMFEDAFSKDTNGLHNATEHMAMERLGDDVVIGVRGVLSEQDYKDVFTCVETILQTSVPTLSQVSP